MPIHLLDGGLGTTLCDIHHTTFTSTTTPLWSSHLLISSPSTLLACQRSFASIPVNVLLTATYQISIEGFARTKTPEYPDGIPRSAIPGYLRTALDIADKACADSHGHGHVTKLALSLGPYGACMVPGREYSGDYSGSGGCEGEEWLARWHTERLRLFVDALGGKEGFEERLGYIAFETIPRLDEIRAVRRAVGEVGVKTPFWISCVFPGEGGRLPWDGCGVEEIVRAALGGLEGGEMPWGVGVNCTKIEKVRGLVGEFGRWVAKMRECGEIAKVPALVLYPDGTDGEVYNTVTQCWEKRDGEGRDTRDWETQLAQVVKDAEKSGPFNFFLVGGCCKASPEHIKRLGQKLEL
ncbi:hypothetical protein FQN51_005169 [Onygenales sp. PD_10]|nr:hypothetical protein FQN51_005169 [Onygenales sp. PD_10]